MKILYVFVLMFFGILNSFSLQSNNIIKLNTIDFEYENLNGYWIESQLLVNEGITEEIGYTTLKDSYFLYFDVENKLMKGRTKISPNVIYNFDFSEFDSSNYNLSLENPLDRFEFNFLFEIKDKAIALKNWKANIDFLSKEKLILKSENEEHHFIKLNPSASVFSEKELLDFLEFKRFKFNLSKLLKIYKNESFGTALFENSTVELLNDNLLNYYSDPNAMKKIMKQHFRFKPFKKRNKNPGAMPWSGSYTVTKLKDGIFILILGIGNQPTYYQILDFKDSSLTVFNPDNNKIEKVHID